MHDELLERRLRSALRDDGDALPFTITAAELERRVAMRGRRTGNARLTLLLAAALAIGTIGGAMLAGGLTKPTPSPVANADVPASTLPTAPTIPAPTGSPALPDLETLLARDAGRVLAAQAYEPPDRPLTLPGTAGVLIPVVVLGDLQAGGDYSIEVACLGPVALEVGVAAVFPSDSLDGPRFTCDGTVQETTVHVDGTAKAAIQYRDTTSWRVVIRGDRRQLPLPNERPEILPLVAGMDELLRVEDRSVDAASEPWGASGLRVEQIGGVPARTIYGADLWCEAGSTIRLLFGDRIDGVLRPSIETMFACDGLVHELGLPLPQANGSQIYIAANPSTRWSLRISSVTPEVSLVHDIAGWELNGGAGPSLNFEDTEISFSNVAGDDGGPLMVVLECAGEPQEIRVDVDVEGILGDAFQTFTAGCEPHGRRTAWMFDTKATGYLVRHAAPAGTWTALSLLVPEATPAP